MPKELQHRFKDENTVHMTFESKHDVWLTVVIWLGAVGMLSASVSLAGVGRWVLAVVIGATAVAMLWMFHGTRYTVTDTELLIRSGPLRWAIPLRSIEHVHPSNDPIASPASSLDRLEIIYDAGRKRILVSPRDKDGFRSALQHAGDANA